MNKPWYVQYVRKTGVMRNHRRRPTTPAVETLVVQAPDIEKAMHAGYCALDGQRADILGVISKDTLDRLIEEGLPVTADE